MPRDRYMEKKTRSQLMRFGLVGGIESDTDPGRVQVLDSNNVFPAPNGSEAGPRPGVEIRKRYNSASIPAGRKVINIETAPPDVDLGYLIFVRNTANARNAIEAGAFVRDRTQLPFQSNSISFFFLESSLNVPFTNDFELSVYASTVPTGIFTFQYRTRDGTAIAGVDYVASGQTLTTAAGQVPSPAFVFPMEDAEPTAIGKFYFVDLVDPSIGAIIGQFGTIVINITGP